MRDATIKVRFPNRGIDWYEGVKSGMHLVEDGGSRQCSRYKIQRREQIVHEVPTSEGDALCDRLASW